MADDKLQLQEESLPSLLDADTEVQEIPTIEVTQDTDGYEDEKEEVTSEIVEEIEGNFYKKIIYNFHLHFNNLLPF